MIKNNAYIDMVGDLFHYGHVRNIENIYNLGYNVIVGIHSDEVVKSYKREPILNMYERIELIQSCKFISKVIQDAPLRITKDFIDTHKLDIVFHSHTEEECGTYNKMYEIPISLGKFIRSEYTSEISTTQIIKRILSRGK